MDNRDLPAIQITNHISSALFCSRINKDDKGNTGTSRQSNDPHSKRKSTMRELGRHTQSVDVPGLRVLIKRVAVKKTSRYGRGRETQRQQRTSSNYPTGRRFDMPSYNEFCCWVRSLRLNDRGTVCIYRCNPSPRICFSLYVRGSRWFRPKPSEEEGNARYSPTASVVL